VTAIAPLPATALRDARRMPFWLDDPDRPGALDPQERYLRALLDEIRAALAAGGRMEAAVETVGRAERGNWLLFDEYHARNVVTAFAELEWE